MLYFVCAARVECGIPNANRGLTGTMLPVGSSKWPIRGVIPLEIGNMNGAGNNNRFCCVLFWRCEKKTNQINIEPKENHF